MTKQLIQLALICVTTFVQAASPVPAREWTRIRAPATDDLTSVHFSDAHHGFAAGAFGTLLKSEDGGVSWSKVGTPVNHSFVSVWSGAPGDVFLGRVGLYRTRDYGETWERDIGGYEAFSGSIFDILFTTPEVGLFIKDGHLFRTTDGGAEWSLTGGSGQFLDDLHHAGGQTIYATGGITFIDISGSTSRGEIERSRDGGTSWAPLAVPGINDIYASAWTSEDEGYVFTFANQAHHTGDGGDNWTVVTESMTDAEGDPLPALLMDAVIDRDGRMIAVDFEGNFLESDNGAVWSLTPGSADPMTALASLPGGAIIAVGNAGSIWRSPGQLSVQPPRITDLRLNGEDEGGTITVMGSGSPGASYQLQVSRDLSHWSIEKFLTVAGTEFSFTVGRSSAVGHWFYRIAETGGP